MMYLLLGWQRGEDRRERKARRRGSSSNSRRFWPAGSALPTAGPLARDTPLQGRARRDRLARCPPNPVLCVPSLQGVPLGVCSIQLAWQPGSQLGWRPPLHHPARLGGLGQVMPAGVPGSQGARGGSVWCSARWARSHSPGRRPPCPGPASGRTRTLGRS